MSDQWFYGENNQQHGPVSLAAIRDRVQAGLTRADDLIWREGLPNWTPAGQVAEVADALPRSPAGPGGYAPQGGYSPQGGYAPQTGYVAPPVDQYGQPLGYHNPNDALAGLEFVGFWWRVLSYIIDAIVLNIVAIPFGIVLGVILAASGTSGQNAELALNLVGMVLQFIIGWLYYGLFESSKMQASLGKMAIGVRVVDDRGARISFGRASGRFFAKILSGIILLIGFIMVGITQRKQGLHDILANTFVVRGRPGYDPRGFAVQQ